MVKVKVVETERERQLAFEVRKKVFVDEQGVPEHLELDDFDATAIHFIVEKDAQIIAAARLRELEAGIGKIERVSVLKEQRGNHLGILIMEYIEEYAKQHDWKTLKLNAQVHAISFYEQLGYVITSPEFLDAYIPHRAMEKHI